MPLRVKSEPQVTYVQPTLPLRKIMLPLPWCAGLSAVTVAEPQPLFVTLAPVSLSAELVKPHWPLAAAVNSATWATLAGPAVTADAVGTADDRLGLAGELAAGLAAVVAVAVGAGVPVWPDGADGAVPVPQAAARHKTPAASPVSAARLAHRGIPCSWCAIASMVSRPAGQTAEAEVLSAWRLVTFLPPPRSPPGRVVVPVGPRSRGTRVRPSGGVTG